MRCARVFCLYRLQDKIDFIADWLLQQVSLEEAAVAEAERKEVLAKVS